jgi:hypothetical protein
MRYAWAMVRIPWTIELENKKGGLKKILLGSYHEGKLIAALNYFRALTFVNRTDGFT